MMAAQDTRSPLQHVVTASYPCWFLCQVKPAARNAVYFKSPCCDSSVCMRVAQLGAARAEEEEDEEDECGVSLEAPS